MPTNKIITLKNLLANTESATKSMLLMPEVEGYARFFVALSSLSPLQEFNELEYSEAFLNITDEITEASQKIPELVMRVQLLDKLEKLKIKTKMNHFAIKYKLILRANQIAMQELGNMAR